MSDSVAQAGPVPGIPYRAFAWYSILLAISFGSVLSALAYQWQNDEDMGHGFFVPVIACFIAWERRAEWLKGGTPNRWGLLLCSWGALQLWAGVLMAELFLQRTSLLVTIAGLILFFGGTRALRILAFPLLLLLFMIPIPGIIYKQITFPLQLISTRLAEWMLDAAGIMVVREGNILELAGQQLSVVEACSGLRALHSLVFFSLTYAYFFDNRAWVKWLLLILVTPVTVTANAGRIVTTGILGQYDRELAMGTYHTISGWMLFVVSIMLLIAAKHAAVWIVGLTAKLRARS